MAKAIIRFGIKGEKHNSVILPTMALASDMANALLFVHGGDTQKEDEPAWASTRFVVSRQQPRVSMECVNGYWVEVEYVPTIAAKNAGA